MPKSSEITYRSFSSAFDTLFLPGSSLRKRSSDGVLLEGLAAFLLPLHR